MERGWWYRATDAEKLAQIDGCIELGMTAKQCAFNCASEFHWQTLVGFGNRHGRYFGDVAYAGKCDKVVSAIFEGGKYTNKRSTLNRRRDAYLSGEPVDFWSVE